MVECIFTLDYEIYGNGTGNLRELVYEPAERLKEVFGRWNARFVNFVEAAELEKIEACGTDPAIDLVRRQVREFYQDGFEIGLHLHPQWSNAVHQDGVWRLDASEYNLCTLSRARIAEIVRGALDYLRRVVNVANFAPISFRAGNWLFQPTETAASVLAENGIKVDSSVFKGGVQHLHGLDYRRASQNGYCWAFSTDVNRADAAGKWIEVPIHTEMVPVWQMPTSKRMSLGNGYGLSKRRLRHRFNRTLDFMRVRYPKKLDFCRMTLRELTDMTGKVLKEDRANPDSYRPLVAIGHTKDLTDLKTVSDFLSFLRANEVSVSTFEGSYANLVQATGQKLCTTPRPEAGNRAGTAGRNAEPTVPNGHHLLQ
jgi:hypothetical protein